MPSIVDKIKIGDESLDRRRVVTDADKATIRLQYATGDYSQRQLAGMYGCSRRTIQFILDPAKLVENKQRRAERGGSKKYYDKDKHAQSIREHRAYKGDLYAKGKIGKTESNGK